MYNSKLAVVSCVIGVVMGYNSNEDLRQIDSIWDESPCLAQGGMCTIAGDCPKGKLVEQRGLCPEQRSRGVECCYGVSVKETRCRKIGGECMESCNERNLIVRHTTNCQKGTACCILVQ